MKCSKIITVALSVLLMAGCAKENSADLSANAEDITVTSPNTIETEVTSSYFQSDDFVSEDAENDSRIFERVSHLNLSEAEQIYTSIYNMTDFTHYLYFRRVAEDIDRNDVIYIERLNTPIIGMPDEKIGKSTPVAYYRIADGRASNGVDLAEWIDSFVSSRYIASEYSQFIDDNFIVSENKIYINEYLVYNSLGHTDTSDLKLDSITVLDEHTGENIIELNFSYTDHGLDRESDYETHESFSIAMSNWSNGWKIYRTETINSYYTALINEFFYNEQESDLLSQIENYLSKHPISQTD